jgi:caspase domain-containing protein
MRRLLGILLLGIVSFTLFTSCELFHTTDTDRGNSYALIYGVADYSPVISSLTYTVNDASDMYNFFNLQDFKITERYNSDATKNAMLADFSYIRGIADENDITVFFFAGHGDGYYRNSPLNTLLEPPFIEEPTEFTGQASLIPYLSSLNNYGIFYASELLDELSSIPGKKLVILDICFAGGFVPDNGVDIDKLPGDYGYKGEVSAFFQAWDKYFTEESNSDYQDIWVIGSAGTNELAYDGNSSTANGYYTYYLLKSLGYNHANYSISEPITADQNLDNLITVSEIYNETFNQFEQNYNNSSSTSAYAKYYSHTSGGSKDLILFDLTL